jgi:hypothetical protein
VLRAAGRTVFLAICLSNASNRYSDLAGLEETREGRAVPLVSLSGQAPVARMAVSHRCRSTSGRKTS